MQVETFIEVIGSQFYAGVPDSQLRALCDYLIDFYGLDPHHHVIAANEGNAVALAAGYHLATGKLPVVYLQNSGEGNIINPVASLISNKVYGIPCLFVIGWRGEPGIHDEPQHIYQGEVTLKLLSDMDIEYYVLCRETTEEDLKDVMRKFFQLFSMGKQAAFVIKKGAFEYSEKVVYKNNYSMLREDIISHIVKFAKDSPIISTTGKASRELFEIRERRNEGHSYDFLTVGSMGHASSIAFEIAMQKPQKKIWIIDGDGAVLMHLGALAVIGAYAPKNIVHVVINNSSHETVGGMPTVADKIDLIKIAQGCGYIHTLCAFDMHTLDQALKYAQEATEITFIEVKSAIGSRANLGRPTTSPIDNKNSFINCLRDYQI